MENKKHFASLDGLRGVAALTVVIVHIMIYFRQSLIPEHAYLAVDFFFLLSGFVISRAYDERLQTKMGCSAFLSVRLIRLYPMIVLGIALGAFVLAVRWWKFHDLTLSSIVWAVASAATLSPTPALVYFRPWAFPVDGPLWSLSLEIFVNLIYAFFFATFRKTLLIIIVILGALAIVVAANTHDGLDFGFRWNDFWLGTVRIVFPFFAGVLLARNIDVSRPLPHWGNAAPLALLVIFFLPVPLWTYDVVATLLLFPMVVYIAARLPKNPRIDGYQLYLGELSYPLYVLHFPIVVAISNAAHQSGIVGWRLSIVAFVCLVVIVTVSAISLKFYDRPVRKALTRRFHKREQARSYRADGILI